MVYLLRTRVEHHPRSLPWSPLCIQYFPVSLCNNFSTLFNPALPLTIGDFEYRLLLSLNTPPLVPYMYHDLDELHERMLHSFTYYTICLHS